MHEINRQSGRNWRDEFDMNANVLWTVGMSLMTVIFLMTSNNIILWSTYGKFDIAISYG